MNWPTILVLALVVAAVIAVAVVLIRNRKKGKHSCGGGCAGCALSGTCHRKSNKACHSEGHRPEES